MTRPSSLTMVVGSAIGLAGFLVALGAPPDSERLGFALLAIAIGMMVALAGVAALLMEP